MARSMTVNVQVNGPPSDIVTNNVGEAKTVQSQRLKAELAVAFAAPDDSYSALTAREVIVRNSTCK